MRAVPQPAAQRQRQRPAIARGHAQAIQPRHHAHNIHQRIHRTHLVKMYGLRRAAVDRRFRHG